MPCQVLPPAINCAYLDKFTIKALQDALANGCPFLEFIYPVAEVGVRNDGQKKHRYPRLFVGEAEKNYYVDLSPDNDRFGKHTFSFFEIENSERVHFRRQDGLVDFRLNLIVWAKQDDITQDKVDITDYLIAKVKKALLSSPVNSIITDMWVEKDKHKVFDSYDYDFEKLRHIAWPYTCFKMVMDVLSVDVSDCIDDTCINPVI